MTERKPFRFTSYNAHVFPVESTKSVRNSPNTGRRIRRDTFRFVCILQPLRLYDVEFFLFFFCPPSLGGVPYAFNNGVVSFFSVTTNALLSEKRTYISRFRRDISRTLSCRARAKGREYVI